MKLLSLLLSAFIFSLSLIPCADGKCVDKEESIFSYKVLQQDNCNDDIEECSPLCVCSCCGIVVTMAEALRFSVLKHFSIAHFFSFDTSKATSDIPTIWQPPKL
jgi:hypothetical protein